MGKIDTPSVTNLESSSHGQWVISSKHLSLVKMDRNIKYLTGKKQL